MKWPSSITLTVGLLVGIGAGLALAMFLHEVWRLAQEHDADPRQFSLKNQMMRHKAEAMRDLLDNVTLGRFNDAIPAVARVREAAAGIDTFLDTDLYRKFGEDFHRAIDDVMVAARAEDREAVKEAVLRLEKSCIECHFSLPAPGE